ILFTVRNQDGGAPWSAVEDVTFTNNVVRHVGGGVNVLGHDDNHPSQQTRRLRIQNNVFLDVGGAWGPGRLFQLLDGTNNVTITHNTALQTGSMLFGGDHAPHTAFVFQNNVAPHNEHGIIGSGTASGTQTIARYFPRSVIDGNVIVGGNPGEYPPGNTFAGSLEDAGIGALRRGELTAVDAQASRKGSTAAGADVAQLLRAINGVAPLETQAAKEKAAATAADASSVADAGAAVLWISMGLL